MESFVLKKFVVLLGRSSATVIGEVSLELKIFFSRSVRGEFGVQLVSVFGTKELRCSSLDLFEFWFKSIV